ncbi:MULTISPECIES: IS3 family transposase [Paenibacillus]|uniref:IS3 family transposase n=1 Tax=Paenibacillus TaxID=44249 RepID=UPI000979E081|nr:hypothetical protein BK134_13900 [Paenibacillus peoriae]
MPTRSAAERFEPGVRYGEKGKEATGRARCYCIATKDFNIPLASAQQVEHAIQKYIHFYNHERSHEKLNNLTPYEYSTQAA